MSDKLKQLSKLTVVVFLLLLNGCTVFRKEPKMNTEIVCPNGKITLVTFVRAKELKRAILVAYKEKKNLRTSENYTAVRLEDGRSFVLKNLPPEVAASCDLVESKVGEVEASYIHHF